MPKVTQQGRDDSGYKHSPRSHSECFLLFLFPSARSPLVELDNDKSGDKDVAVIMRARRNPVEEDTRYRHLEAK